jgi:hypothetical protein
MAAARADPNGGTPIEALFRLTARFVVPLPEDYTEVELLPHLTLEDVLATGITWDDLCIFLEGKIVWLAPGVFIRTVNSPTASFPLVLSIGANTYQDLNLCRVHLAPGAAYAAATATCDFLVRLLATCDQRELHIAGTSPNVPPPVSGTALSFLFQECPDNLRQVKLGYMALSEGLCLALATTPRLDVELGMMECTLVDGAAGAFVECLQSERGGPVKLTMCEIDDRALARALIGNSRVTQIRSDYVGTNDADRAVLFTALASNRGLVNLDLRYCYTSNANFAILCESLKAHPSLTSLEVRSTIPALMRGDVIEKEARMRMIADMMEHNTILQTIHLWEDQYGRQIYSEEILPRLETNTHRPRVLAVEEIDDRLVRQAVLGRTVYRVRSNPNLVWMFLSQNVDAFARSEEEDENRNSVQGRIEHQRNLATNVDTFVRSEREEEESHNITQYIIKGQRNLATKEYPHFCQALDDRLRAFFQSKPANVKVFPAVDLSAGTAVYTCQYALRYRPPEFCATLRWYPSDWTGSGEYSPLDKETRAAIRIMAKEADTEDVVLFSDPQGAAVFPQDEVFLEGLSRAEYNGLKGIVLHHDAKSPGRFAVQLELTAAQKRKNISLKAENLFRMGSPENGPTLERTNRRQLSIRGEAKAFYNGLLERACELDLQQHDTWSNVQEIYGRCALVTATSILTCMGHRAPLVWQDSLEIASRLLMPGGILMQYDTVNWGDYGDVRTMLNYSVTKSLGLILEERSEPIHFDDDDGSMILLVWIKVDVTSVP